MITSHELRRMIEICRSEPELDRQIEFLQQINKSLPSSIQVEIPWLVTNDIVDRALDKIEEATIFNAETENIQGGCT